MALILVFGLDVLRAFDSGNDDEPARSTPTEVARAVRREATSEATSVVPAFRTVTARAGQLPIAAPSRAIPIEAFRHQQRGLSFLISELTASQAEPATFSFRVTISSIQASIVEFRTGTSVAYTLNSEQASAYADQIARAPVAPSPSVILDEVKAQSFRLVRFEDIRHVLLPSARITPGTTWMGFLVLEGHLPSETAAVVIIIRGTEGDATTSWLLTSSRDPYVKLSP